MDADKFRAGLRVLAVDDDRVSLLLVEKQLQRCKYNVTTVMHAEMALEILRARKDHADQFDLVITDVHMPEMDGFKLLEVISLEMDVPVIMLSANDTLGAMMKGIQHGACDYFAKPARLEQLKTLWMHVVRNKMNDPSNRISNSDDDGQKLQSRDGEAENGANQNMMCLRKNRKDECGTKEDKENTSTSKRTRFEWSGALHRKFVEAVNRIGMDKAVPKTILEMMNVEGLRREHVASHLQKFRLYLKKLASGTSSRHGLFTDEVVLSEGNSINITGQEHFDHNLENGRYYHPSISFAGFSSSSNPFGRLNSSAAFGTHNLLPTQSVELMTQRSLGITTLKNMGAVGYGGNMSRVAVPGSQQDLRNFTSCGISNTSMCFPSGPSGSSFANVSNGMPSNSFANIPNASSPLAASMERLWYPFRSYARQCMADGEELPPPSSNLPMKQPIESAATFKGLSDFPKSGKTVEISKFLDLGSEGKTTEVDSFEGNSHTINRLSRFAASSSGQTSEFQNQMAALTKKTTMPMARFNEQVAPFNIGSSTSSTMIKNHMSVPSGASSTVSTFPNLQMNKPVMLSEMLNGEGVIVDQQAFGDELNNNNGFLETTSTAQNGTNASFDDFFGAWLNQDVLKNGDAFMGRDWEFTP